MNRTELINMLYEKSGLRKNQCTAAINAFQEILEEQCGAGERVVLSGFGTFYKNKRGKIYLKPSKKQRSGIEYTATPGS